MPEHAAGPVMTAAELEAYLHERIPLTRAMAVEVRVAGPDGVEVYAPLAPNINHRDTVFGGSASAVAIVAAWSALHVRMRAAGLDVRLVIRRNTMSYERPISTGFTATAAPPAGDAWDKLVATVGRGRPARVNVQAQLHCEGHVMGELDGEFAVLPKA
jgi:thioesterase domain-containing protein